MADMTVSTRVVVDHFPRIIAGMVGKAENITAKAAMDMERGMKRRIQAQGAVDTGFLLNSVQAQRVGAAYWRVTVGADYGLFVDQGTRFMAARPFFHPTVAEVTPAFISAMRSITAP